MVRAKEERSEAAVTVADKRHSSARPAVQARTTTNQAIERTETPRDKTDFFSSTLKGGGEDTDTDTHTLLVRHAIAKKLLHFIPSLQLRSLATQAECPRTLRSPAQDSCFLSPGETQVSEMYEKSPAGSGIKKENSRRHCVAAPFSRLSMVTHTTARLPLECTPKPPTSTPCLPEMFLTIGASPTILMSLSPA